MDPDASYPELDDHTLMQRLVERDTEALETLYDRHGGLVYRIGLRVLHDSHEAEQLLVDVFFELWHQAGRFNPNRASPRTYLITVARSRAIDRLRKQRRVPRPTADPAEAVGAQAGGDDALGHALSQEWAEVLQASLQELSDQERHAIELVYYEGLTHAELAERMNSPLGTVKTWVRRALSKLRHTVAQRYDPQEQPPPES